MKTKLLLLALAGAALCGPARAQYSNGYVFAAATTIPQSAFTFWNGNYWHLGGGGEASVWRGLTLGGEAGVLLANAADTRTSGILSFTPAYHFLTRGKLDPFVTGGPSLLVAGGVGRMVTFGGGANYWLSRKVGLRLEVRDHLWTPDGSAVHFLSFRVGVTFRR